VLPRSFPSPEGSTWSLLLPICSRGKSPQAPPKHSLNDGGKGFSANRFLELSLSSQHDRSAQADESACWSMLEEFCATLRATSSGAQLQQTEVIVGIDADDALYQNGAARVRIREMVPCRTKFVSIQPELYGKLCRIWNFLARHASNDYVVLLGDDVRLLDAGWQDRIAQAFSQISDRTGLPLGAACVAMNDLSFPGFPTFPVVHRWHIESFGSLLPKQVRGVAVL
jgi:hypothetical protein